MSTGRCVWCWCLHACTCFPLMHVAHSHGLCCLYRVTGTGKTLAFVLPIAQRLLQEPRSSTRNPRILILEPTRELAKYEMFSCV